MAFAVFLGSNRDPGRGMLHPFSPYRVLRCFSPLPRRFKPFYGRCIRCILTSRTPFYGSPTCPTFHGFLTASRPINARFVRVRCGFKPLCNRFTGSLSGRVSRCSLFVRSLFVGVFLGVRSEFMGRDPREFAGSSRGQHQGAPVLNFATSLRARVYEAK